MRKGIRDKGQGTRVVLVALALLLSTMTGMAHPFDGDGSGPAKEGGSNVQAYLYVEPFTCRVECLIWLPTALAALGLPQGDAMLLPAEVKEQLIEKARAAALNWCELTVDGTARPMGAVTAQVVKGVPGRSENPAPGELVAVTDAMLGLTWDFAAPVAMETVGLRWREFPDSIKAVPLTVNFGPMSEAGLVMNAASPEVTWKNGCRLPPPKPLAEVPPVPQPETFSLPVASLVWVAVAGFFLLRKSRHSRKVPGRKFTAAGILVLGAVMFWRMGSVEVAKPWVSRKMPTPQDAQRVLQALLRNTYRAFDQRGESEIYDVLSRSIHGDLLQSLYLQTTQALALEGQDGTRVRVTDLDVQVDGVRLLRDREGFVVEGVWTALGTVGHWGHMHQRVNRYTARLTVEPVEGAWKLTGLEVLEERRM